MRILRSLATGLVMVLLFVLAAEATVRIVRPQPRRNLIHTSIIGPFSEVLGVPVYHNTGWTTRTPPQPAGCSDPSALRLTLSGSSILHGVAIPYEAAPEAVLQGMLEARSEGRSVCVKNLAVPGFKTLQVLALAEQAMLDDPPDVLVVEAWDSGHAPVRIGDLMVPLSGDPADPWFGNPLHLPQPVHAWLGSRSRAYAFGLAALPDKVGRPLIEDWIAAPLDRIVALAAQSQTRVVLVLPVGFGSKSQDRLDGELRLEEAWREHLTARGVNLLTFREVFEGMDTEPLCIDPVHLSEAGVQVVSEALVELVLPMMPPVTTPQPDDATAN